MQVYSFELNLFLKRLKQYKDELSLEIKYHLPVEVILFEDNKKLGFFTHRFGQPIVGINKKFAELDFKLAQDVFKHEIAHYICRKRHDDDCQDHGPKFRQVCKEIGANPKAKESLDSMKERLGVDHHDKIVEKVKKLMRLGSSSNEHEAELATLKANELLMKYNIAHVTESDKVYFDQVLKIGQRNAKSRTIVSILESFGVMVVHSPQGKLNRAGQWVRRNYVLEASGSKASVEIAGYVADFLDKELERLYKKASKEHNFKGLRAKNAFFSGIRSGYLFKFRAQKQKIEESNDTKALTAADDRIKKLAEELIYENRLSSMRGSNEAGHGFAEDAGFDAGQKLSINKGVTNQTKTLKLGYNK